MIYHAPECEKGLVLASFISGFVIIITYQHIFKVSI